MTAVTVKDAEIAIMVLVLAVGAGALQRWQRRNPARTREKHRLPQPRRSTPSARHPWTVLVVSGALLGLAVYVLAAGYRYHEILWLPMDATASGFRLWVGELHDRLLFWVGTAFWLFVAWASLKQCTVAVVHLHGTRSDRP